MIIPFKYLGSSFEEPIFFFYRRNIYGNQNLVGRNHILDEMSFISTTTEI
jgi:hypothetical protein